MVKEQALESASPRADTPPTRQKRPRRTLQYVSRHFAPTPNLEPKARKTRKRVKLDTQSKQDSAGASVSVAVNYNSSKRLSSQAVKDVYAIRTKRAQKVKTESEQSDGLASDNASLHNYDGIDEPHLVRSDTSPSRRTQQSAEQPASLAQQKCDQPRMIFGLDIDALSSESDLTDVPDDIGPDPFDTEIASSSSSGIPKGIKKKEAQPRAPEVIAVKQANPTTIPKPKPKPGLTRSPFFPHPHKPRPHFLSTLPFPPLHLDCFGLMQERLCHDPYRLLLATIFLNKTPGQRAMPIFFKLMERYPTPEALANAEQADVTDMIRELGFQNQRARKCIAMSKIWLRSPPTKGKRWRKIDYPRKGNGRDIKQHEFINDDDMRVAWEISHLPGLGPYSHDSWRMFCRDELRGLAKSYRGEGAEEDFEPEWKRVLPADKELRAWMTWSWMKEGWIWNKETGERIKASDELMDLARGEGNVVLESEASTLAVKSLDSDHPGPLKLAPEIESNLRVEVPAGDFLPSNGTSADDRAVG